MRNSALVSALLAAAVSMTAATPLRAQTLDVKQLDVDKGALGLAVDTTVQRGLPAGFDRSSHEIGVGFGLTDWWSLSGVLNIANPAEAGGRLSRAVIENVFVLKPLSGTRSIDYGLGWFAAVAASTNGPSTQAVIFGPILGFKADKLSVTGNPFFEQTFRRNHTEGLAFSYGWQAKVELTKRLSQGVEGFGVIENLGASPPLAQQEHRIGPVVFTELDLGRDVTIAPDIGVLFGLTRGAPDVALKVNVGIPLIEPARGR